MKINNWVELPDYAFVETSIQHVTWRVCTRSSMLNQQMLLDTDELLAFLNLITETPRRHICVQEREVYILAH